MKLCRPQTRHRNRGTTASASKMSPQTDAPTKPRNSQKSTLLQSVEVVGDCPRLTHLPGAAPIGYGGRDRLTRSLRSSRPWGCHRQSSSFACGKSRFFVDIEPDVEFSFCHMVRLSVRFSLVDTERIPAQRGDVLADRFLRIAREYERQTHHLFQGLACRLKAGPQP
jgi:hypothetical protein